MHRLWKLSNEKDKLKKKLVKIESQIEKIDKEALSYQGKEGWGADIFIQCLVYNWTLKETV